MSIFLEGCGGGSSDSGGGGSNNVSNPGPNVAGTYNGRGRGFVMDRKVYIKSSRLQIVIKPGGNVTVNWKVGDTTLPLSGQMDSETTFTSSFDGAEQFVRTLGEFCSSKFVVTDRFDRGVIFGETRVSLKCDSGRYAGGRDYFAERGGSARGSYERGTGGYSLDDLLR